MKLRTALSTSLLAAIALVVATQGDVAQAGVAPKPVIAPAAIVADRAAEEAPAVCMASTNQAPAAPRPVKRLVRAACTAGR